MAGIRHDVLVLALKDNPALLSMLLERLQGASLPGPLRPVDSVVRFTGALEVIPDIVLTTPDPTIPWVIAEVQNRRDETKGKTWDLATSALPPPLREAQTRAILAMLGQRLLDYLQEMAMDVNKIPETKASRAFRLFFENRGKAEGLAEGKAEGKAEGLAEGKRASLLTVLAARGLTPSATERKQIAALEDESLLDECIRCAVTAATVAEALAPLRRLQQLSPRRSRSRHASPAKSALPAKKVDGHRR
jgi:hypothetical protein